MVLVRGGLSLSFVLRVTVRGQTVGYVASEEAFDNARADVLVRVNSARQLLASDNRTLTWDVDPTYTLTFGRATMTESEVANEILRISGSEICEATAVYLDGSLRFVTTEGDHLRRYLNSVKAPWEDPTDQNARVSFAHDLRLVDGIYLTDSVISYADVLAALQANDGEDLQVKVSERVTETREIAYDTETQEDSELDFGKSETVQQGVAGSEAVTRELTYLNGALIDDQVVDVQVLQSPTPEIIRQGHPAQERHDRQAGHRHLYLASTGIPGHLPLGQPGPHLARFPPCRGHCGPLRHTDLRLRQRHRGGGREYAPQLGQLCKDRPRQRLQNAVRPYVQLCRTVGRYRHPRAGHWLCR